VYFMDLYILLFAERKKAGVVGDKPLAAKFQVISH
jgi:hypothetical protein